MKKVNKKWDITSVYSHYIILLFCQLSEDRSNTKMAPLMRQLDQKITASSFLPPLAIYYTNQTSDTVEPQLSVTLLTNCWINRVSFSRFFCCRNIWSIAHCISTLFFFSRKGYYKPFPLNSMVYCSSCRTVQLPYEIFSTGIKRTLIVIRNIKKSVNNWVIWGKINRGSSRIRIRYWSVERT